MTIKIIGLSQRGKNRITEHGDEFNVLFWNGSSDIYLESLDRKWFGWFEIGTEIRIVNDSLN